MKMRLLEVLKDDHWIKLSSMSKLKIGDEFRMFEPTGEPVKDKHGKTNWIVASDPKRILNENKVYTYAVEIEGD